MSIPILIAGLLSLFAFFAHAFIGHNELNLLKPGDDSPDKHQEVWIQARSGWHWVSVDLFLAGTLLILLATTEIISAQVEVLQLLALYFAVCGLVWLGTVLFSRSSNRQILQLGQWIFCFLMSGLIYFGS
ncbi:MAG: hypothetical protein AAF485_04450 [Chloroflexota bacterium]